MKAWSDVVRSSKNKDKLIVELVTSLSDGELRFFDLTKEQIYIQHLAEAGINTGE